MIDVKEIYQVTRKGLDIILHYYPSAADVVSGSKKHFRMRDERTPSASIKEYNDCYRVCDFGGDSTSLSPVDIVMSEERVNFYQAVLLLADRYGVADTQISSSNRPEFKSEPAPDDRPLGTEVFYHEHTADEHLKIWGHKVKEEHLAQLSYYSVSHYATTKLKDSKRITTTIYATDRYPIFARECGEFRKVYQPLAHDKAYRFFYVGKKEKNYINGLQEARSALTALNEQDRTTWEQDPAHEGIPYKEKKLEALIICSGERDAVNVRSYGYHPLWLNSETDHISPEQYKQIRSLAERIYNIPDIDPTGIRRGIELGMQYTEIYTVELPTWLLTYKDNRGKPRKDLRDYLEICTHRHHFDCLLNTAKCYQFYERKLTDKGMKLEINSVYLNKFLRDSGFYRIAKAGAKKDLFMYLKDNMATEVTPQSIRSYLIDYTDREIANNEITNLVMNSQRTGVARYSDLPERDITPCLTTHDTQLFFFSNTAVRLSHEGIHTLQHKDAPTEFWNTQVLKKPFRPLPPAFCVKNIQDCNTYDFEVHHTKSHIFRYLINGSRIHWRAELEEREETDPEANLQYAHENDANIMGARLTHEEHVEQVRNLCAKLYAIGYLLHSYKQASAAYLVWIMEDRLSADGESSGGSGKSLLMQCIHILKDVVELDGRNSELFKNKHVFENVTETTDIINVEDFSKKLDFDYLYNSVTMGLKVDEKHTKSNIIRFEDAPKLSATSNFAPRSRDSSTARRLLYVVFSDYYHTSTHDNDYRETRQVRDTFGYDLLDDKYADEFWNEDYNFLLNCLQFYLQMKQVTNQPVTPPMERVWARMNISTMGEHFRYWADVYFAPESDNLNREILREDAFNDCITTANIKAMTAKKFMTALKAYCDNAEHIDQLNPPEVCNTKDGRIIRKITTYDLKRVPKEKIYIQQVGHQVNLNT